MENREILKSNVKKEKEFKLSKREFVVEILSAIGFCAFANSQIQSITIPENVTEIIRLAFSNCDKLTHININTTKLQVKGTVEAFTDCTHLEDIHFVGTMKEWNNMKPAIELRCGTNVYCSDGAIYYDFLGDVLTVK
jgi:hypothetical protein